MKKQTAAVLAALIISAGFPSSGHAGELAGGMAYETEYEYEYSIKIRLMGELPGEEQDNVKAVQDNSVYGTGGYYNMPGGAGNYNYTTPNAVSNYYYTTPNPGMQNPYGGYPGMQYQSDSGYGGYNTGVAGVVSGARTEQDITEGTGAENYGQDETFLEITGKHRIRLGEAEEQGREPGNNLEQAGPEENSREDKVLIPVDEEGRIGASMTDEIGRASCRERV